MLTVVTGTSTTSTWSRTGLSTTSLTGSLKELSTGLSTAGSRIDDESSSSFGKLTYLLSFSSEALEMSLLSTVGVVWFSKNSDAVKITPATTAGTAMLLSIVFFFITTLPNSLI